MVRSKTSVLIRCCRNSLSWIVDPFSRGLIIILFIDLGPITLYTFRDQQAEYLAGNVVQNDCASQGWVSFPSSSMLSSRALHAILMMLKICRFLPFRDQLAFAFGVIDQHAAAQAMPIYQGAYSIWGSFVSWELQACEERVQDLQSSGSNYIRLSLRVIDVSKYLGTVPEVLIMTALFAHHKWIESGFVSQSLSRD